MAGKNLTLTIPDVSTVELLISGSICEETTDCGTLVVYYKIMGTKEMV